MKTSISLYTIVILCFVASSCSRGNITSKELPNIVFIMADDLGWSDVGYIGGPYDTPNIDKIASEGLMCTRFYPSAANCAPSRASILTGMYAPRHNVYVPQGLSRGGKISKMRFKTPSWNADSSFFNTFDVSINQVDSSVVSLAELLNRAGYVTARFGKWHIGGDNQGFDVNSAAGVIGETTNRTVKHQVTKNLKIPGGKEERFYQDTVVAERMTDAAINFITQNQSNPFFIYLSHWEVHTPLAARKDRIDYYKNKFKTNNRPDLDPVYAAEIEQIDLSAGRIMNALEKLNLSMNTIVLFTSDNGGVSRYTSNKPLRAGKGTFYEGGIRTPLCIRWPEKIQPGTTSDFPVSGIDFMPTFAEIADVPLPQTQPVDGISLLPLLNGDRTVSDRTMFFHFPLYLGGGGPDKVLPTWDGQENYWRAVPLSVIIKGNWKLIYYYEYDSCELFNLSEDISESNDLSKVELEMTDKLLTELNDWVSAVDAPVPEIKNNPN